MIKRTKTIFSRAERKSIVSFILSASLAFMVTLESAKRITFRKLISIGDVQSVVVFSIIYLITLPFNILILLITGQLKSSKQDIVVAPDDLIGKDSNFTRMY